MMTLPHSKILAVGVVGSIGVAAVALLLGEMSVAMGAFIGIALFAYGYNWVPDNE